MPHFLEQAGDLAGLVHVDLLGNGNLGQTGFGDYSGFYRAFKQEYGISPRQYRKLQEEQDKYGK